MKDSIKKLEANGIKVVNEKISKADVEKAAKILAAKKKPAKKPKLDKKLEAKKKVAELIEKAVAILEEANEAAGDYDWNAGAAGFQDTFSGVISELEDCIPSLDEDDEDDEELNED
jgi:fructose-specific phosphotransferase system component IIB